MRGGTVTLRGDLLGFNPSPKQADGWKVPAVPSNPAASVLLLLADILEVLECGESARFSWGSCFSIHSVLRPRVSEMVGTSSWTVLVCSSQSSEALTFVQHFVLLMPTNPSHPRHHPESLTSLELHEHLRYFLGLLLLTFLPCLDSTKWLSSGFYSPLCKSFLCAANLTTTSVQRTTISLPYACPLLCKTPHTVEVEPPDFS